MEQDISECDEFPETAVCEECGGAAVFMGTLGKADYFRCRSCGWEQGEVKEIHFPHFNRLKRNGEWLEGCVPNEHSPVPVEPSACWPRICIQVKE